MGGKTRAVAKGMRLLPISVSPLWRRGPWSLSIERLTAGSALPLGTIRRPRIPESPMADEQTARPEFVQVTRR